MHLQAIMYHFEDIDYDIHLNFQIQIRQILSEHVFNVHQ